MKKLLSILLLGFALYSCGNDPVPEPEPTSSTWQGGGANPAAYISTNTGTNSRIKPAVGTISADYVYGIGTAISDCSVTITSLDAGEQITSVGLCWARDVARPDRSAYSYVYNPLSTPITQADLQGGSKTFTIQGNMIGGFAIPGAAYNYCFFVRSNQNVIYYSDPKSYTIPAIPLTGVTEKYPVIFHVLYNNAEQNVRQEYIDAFLAYANLAMNNKMTPTVPIDGYDIPAGADTQIELVLATTDPEGLTLPVAGVDRRAWSQSSTDADSFLKTAAAGDQTALLWDPYTYLNVWLFDFKDEPSTAGMALMPVVPSSYPLDGLSDSNAFIGQARPSDGRKPGVCLNSNSSTVDYAQSFGHEVGHCFGLFHTFSTSGCGRESDYCADTPEYVLDVNNFSGYPDDPRTACDGTQFISYNIMDYYGLGLQFSPDQVLRTSHVQNYGYFIPGSQMATRTRADIPPGSDMTLPEPRVIRLPAVVRGAPAAVGLQQVD